jgi:hypothetical protein
MRGDNSRKIREREAQTLWQLGKVGMASKTVREKVEAGAYIKAVEVVVKTADMP